MLSARNMCTLIGFLSTPSARRATCCDYSIFLFALFLSTPSARRATSGFSQSTIRRRVFLSTPSARRATKAFLKEKPIFLFLSTPSARRATSATTSSASTAFNFYPRPPRGGRHPNCDKCCKTCDISIHALREEGDALVSCHTIPPNISIHALREEGDLEKLPFCLADRLFLSTPSARRATLPATRTARLLDYFYPRPPRGGRHTQLAVLLGISLFLSTPSARRATAPKYSPRRRPKISIHALREEGDR